MLDKLSALINVSLIVALFNPEGEATVRIANVVAAAQVLALL